MTGYDEFLKSVENEFYRRIQKNRSYSMRSYAQSLGMSRTSLCEGLSKRRKLSTKNIVKIGESLSISPVILEQAVGDANRAKPTDSRNEMILKEDEFNFISDWYHIAIFTLLETNKQNYNSKEISHYFGITVTEAELALSRLQRLGLISPLGNGSFELLKKDFVCSSDGIASKAIKKHHRQQLELADKSLFRDSVDIREFQSVTIPTNKQMIKQAKPLIEKFIKDMENLMLTSKKTDVYTLGIQLFPTTNRDDGGDT